MSEQKYELTTDQAEREASGAHSYGRYLEEFEVGAVYKHWPAKTVTEADDHLFCLITMNHHPLHLNDVYAKESQQGRNVVVGPLVYSLALGMSVSDVSGKAIANLATEELSHPNPVFHGDTLFCETEVLDVKPSQVEARPRRRQGPHPGAQPGRRPRRRVQAAGAGAAARAGRRVGAEVSGSGLRSRCQPTNSVQQIRGFMVRHGVVLDGFTQSHRGEAKAATGLDVDRRIADHRAALDLYSGNLASRFLEHARPRLAAVARPGVMGAVEDSVQPGPGGGQLRDQAPVDRFQVGLGHPVRARCRAGW